MKKSKVLKAARRLIREDGLVNMTLAALCYELEIPEGSFMHHTGMKFNELVSELRFSDKSSKIHSPVKQRVQKDARKDHILKHATRLAKTKGYHLITRADVAEAADVSPPLVTYHFESMQHLRSEIMKRAIAEENLKIIGQGLVTDHPVVLKAPLRLKKAAARFIGAMD